MRALAELEGSARPALVGALQKNPPLEMKRRLETLVKEIDAPPEPALQIARAVLAMELSAAPAAQALLQEWAAGTAGMRLTEQARAALARIRSRPNGANQ
jgi:hypothetical protein